MDMRMRKEREKGRQKDRKTEEEMLVFACFTGRRKGGGSTMCISTARGDEAEKRERERDAWSKCASPHSPSSASSVVVVALPCLLVRHPYLLFSFFPLKDGFEWIKTRTQREKRKRERRGVVGFFSLILPHTAASLRLWWACFLPRSLSPAPFFYSFSVCMCYFLLSLSLSISLSRKV